MREHYPRFSDAEVKRRYDLVYGLMDELALDCLVLYGDSTLGNLHQLNCHWLSNYLDEQYCYVVLPRNGSPVLFVSIPADAPAAMAVSPIEDVRGGGVGVQMGPAVARTLKEVAGAARRVGTVANFAVAGGLPHSHHEAFVEALPNAELIDVARDYEDLRVVPSEEEMEWFGKGVALTDLAWERLVDAIEPGRTEAELLGAVHSAYMLEGGSYCFAILGATPMREPLMAYPHGIPNQGALRPVQDGDLVICEMSASYYGYAGQCFCSVAVGEPSEAVAEAAQFTGELYDDLCKVVRAGNTDTDVARGHEPRPGAGMGLRGPVHPRLGHALRSPDARIRELDPMAGRVPRGRVDRDRAQPVHGRRSHRPAAGEPDAGGCRRRHGPAQTGPRVCSQVMTKTTQDDPVEAR